MANKNDKIILDLKKEIEKKKKLIKDQRFNPTTNCSLELDGARYNLHVINQETILFLVGKLRAMELALSTIFQGDQHIKIGGYFVHEWIEDLLNKYKILDIVIEKQRLKVLEDKLHNLLTTDTKVGLEIEDLKKEIG